MSIGKIDRLERILDKVVAKSNGRITNCVVTNERGLIVAGAVLNGSSNEILAAMISLLSDTVLRISENLGLGSPKTALVKTLGATISMCEFLVISRRFRIGVVLAEENPGRFSFFSRRMTMMKLETSLSEAAREIRTVLEGT